MKNLKNSMVWVPLIVAVTFMAGLMAGGLLQRTPGVSKATHKLGTILNLVASEYVDDVDLDSLVDMTLPALLSNLDPHSVYIPKSRLTDVNDELESSFSGIGVQFMMQNDSITVLEVVSGGPSEKVGLMAGDRIVTIDGEDVTNKGLTPDEVRSMLKGEAGTRVKLGIKRKNSKSLLDYEVTRGDIPVTSVDASYIINDSVGFIRVNRFGRSTFEEFYMALMLLRAEGARSYIIDLRGNTGGFMEVAIYMANEFLADGDVIVQQRGRNGRNNDEVRANGKGAFQDAPVVVLLDEYSASSSEIFAGALQDNDRGLIVGRRSFGKGLIQRQVDLPDSSAIRLTIARYYTPSGRCIQKDYTDNATYERDIAERYNHGEAFERDSVKLNTEDRYLTAHGREVFGGGGIMPDIFVPYDTTGVTNYYIAVANAGLLQRFAFEFCDLNRDMLNEAEDVEAALPADGVLLRSFVSYAGQNGIPARWYYINLSRDLIVNQLKALIMRDILGTSAYYEISNRADNTVQRALQEIQQGNAAFPLADREKQ
ncbi:MAG: PDZ domain-containing protein [Muribaculaceae bacterium]|nr:PDZ domain-containing protein [Muribaculaceae bacterium]